MAWKLVVGDGFTKWTEAYAIPNQEALTIASLKTSRSDVLSIHNSILIRVSSLSLKSWG